MAHTINKPVDEIPSTGDTRPVNHAGFGYLNTSSEAEAADKVNFVCPENKKITETKAKCNPFRDEFSPDDKQIEGMYKAMNGAIYDQTLRDKVFDYLVLQKASLSAKRPVDIKKPTCLTKDAMGKNLPVVSDDQTTRTENIIKLQEKFDKTNNKAQKEKLKKQLDLKVKLNAMKSNQSPKKLAQALILDDQYRSARKSTDCENTTVGWKLQKCASIKEFQTKLRQSYPSLFRQPELINPAPILSKIFPIPQKDISAAQSVNAPDSEKQIQLRNSIKRLVGSHNAPEDATEADIMERGSKLYQASIDSSYGVGWDENSVDNLFNSSFDAGTVGEYDPSLGQIVWNFITGNEDQTDPFAKYNDSANELNSNYNKALENELGFLCGSKQLEQLSGKDLTKMYPQVVKQMLLDTNEVAFDQAKYFICKNNLQNVIGSPTANSCVGVSGDIDDDKGMQVNRSEYTFPFAGTKNYNIKKVGEELIVSTKINFEFIYDSSIPETRVEQKAQFDQKLRQWKTKTNAYFSSLKAKMKPPVTFKYEVGTDTSAPPVVKVSTCYNRTLPKADKHSCDKVRAAGGNWQDAGNYTFDTDDKTLSHEMGHQLGLDDEYSAAYYPINNLGEDDSIMNSGVNLYPRHVRRIVQPALRCGGYAREELTPVLK
jgi:hypothetical protein